MGVSATNNEVTVKQSRGEVPEMGYRNYWYPAIQSGKVKKKPVPVSLLGEAIVLFRDTRTGKVYGLQDRCPHRGIPLSLGRSYFPGTVSCAYHGWTFDRRGQCVAELTEGPDSPLPGKVSVHVYPLEERWGVVWVYIGEGSPPPLEEDVPEEFLDPGTRMFLDVQEWDCNWNELMENSSDPTHAIVLHRRAVTYLFQT
jgi:phenylpropionate dioxygenase-like ring-hydroxylating dioxygenase large terminal subunit